MSRLKKARLRNTASGDRAGSYNTTPFTTTQLEALTTAAETTDGRNQVINYLRGSLVRQLLKIHERWSERDYELTF